MSVKNETGLKAKSIWKRCLFGLERKACKKPLGDSFNQQILSLSAVKQD